VRVALAGSIAGVTFVTSYGMCVRCTWSHGLRRVIANSDDAFFEDPDWY